MSTQVNKEQAHSRWVKLGQLKLHYLEWDNAGKPVSLFLHGGGLNANTWKPACEILRQGYHCIALDQRGHGESDWSPTGNYSPEAQADDVERFRREKNLGRMHLVGMSMGGINALTYATRRSRHLAGLVIVDVGPTVRSTGAQEILQFMRGNTSFANLEEAVDAARRFNPRRSREDLLASLPGNLRSVAGGRLTWKWDPARLEGIEVQLARNAALWQDLERVHCPVLVVRGAESATFLDADAEQLASALPDGRWVRIENAGHNVHSDNPIAFAEQLQLFFSGVETSRSST